MVHQVKDMADFKGQLSSAGEKLVVVDFFATWCGPCKMIAPRMEEMSKNENMSDVVFLKVDVDECEDIATEYKITAMPTFIFLKKGVQQEMLMGANVEKLKEMVNKFK
jgi:thioredoxin 1